MSSEDTPPRERIAAFEQEMEGRWIGPLSVDRWKRECLSGYSPMGAQGSHMDVRNVPVEGKHALIEAIINSDVLPVEPASFYADNPPIGTSTSPVLDNTEQLARIRSRVLVFADMESTAEDPCDFNTESENVRERRSNLVSYAHSLFQNPHRTFVLGFIAMPMTARFIRFDRSGAVFSEPFTWRDDADHVLDFLQWIEDASPAQRGLDTSVIALPPGSKEGAEARNILVASDALPQGIEIGDVIPATALGPDEPSLVLFRVFDDESGSFHSVVAHTARTASSPFVGRGTQGYLAVDLDEKCAVYMKDSWRVSFKGVLSESDILRRLKRHNVRYLPDFYFGGDVRECVEPEDAVQTTRGTYALARELMGPGTAVQLYTHHRVLVKKIGRQLDSFKSTWELCHAVFCATTGHTDALDKAQVIHRDISTNNIMIDKDGEGMLVDWDLAKYCRPDRSESNQKTRAGTLHFMAIPLLDGGVSRHTRRLDLESFFYVLLYNVLRYTEAYGPDTKCLFNVFRHVFLNDWPGGKTAVMRNTNFADEELWAGNTHARLWALIAGLRQLFMPIYEHVPERSTAYAYDDTEDEPMMREYMLKISVPASKRVEVLNGIAAAKASLDNSAAAFMQPFELLVEGDRDHWPVDDAAQDRFPPDVLKTFPSY